MVPLAIASLAGVLSTIAGSFALGNTFLFYLTQSSSGFDAAVSADSLGRTGIVLNELLVSIAFSVLALLFMAMRSSRQIQAFSILAGAVRLMLLGLTLSLHWKMAWYYLLDPAGRNQICYAVLTLSIVQAVSFFLCRRETVRRGAHENPISIDVPLS